VCTGSVLIHALAIVSLSGRV